MTGAASWLPRVILCVALAWMLCALSAQAGPSCLVVVDASSGKVVKEFGPCRQRVTPASTFKIAISLMGFDSGFLKDGHAPLLPFRPGYPDWRPEWRTAIDPTSWIKYSVVWYSQQITQALGPEKFQRYTTEFHYGNADVSGDPGKHNGLTRAWLSSSLQISPLEQVTFLQKLVRRQLPVSQRATEMTSRITKVTTLPGGWEIHGKTGSGPLRKPDGTEYDDRVYGWFVGWAVRGNRTFVFARLIEKDGPDAITAGPSARDDLLLQLPAILNAATSTTWSKYRE